MNFGLKLKKIRKDNNLSQEAFAEMLYVSQGNYSLYESNQRTPSIDFLMRLIEKFSLDANWLLCEQDVEFYNNIRHNIETLKIDSDHREVSEKLKAIEQKLDMILQKY